MTIRTCEFLYHTNKYILNRPLWSSIKKIILVMVETVVIVGVSNYLPYLRNIGYINWFINAIMTVVFSTVITIVLNLIFCFLLFLILLLQASFYYLYHE